eukprot:COSAG06_NODE_63912_length_261_cov_0.623457_1_plen_52_part_10
MRKPTNAGQYIRYIHMQSQEVHRHKQANSNNTSQENTGRKRQPRGHADAEAE